MVAVFRQRDHDDLVVEYVHRLADQAGVAFLFAGQIDDQDAVAHQLGVGIFEEFAIGEAGREAGLVEGIDQQDIDAFFGLRQIFGRGWKSRKAIIFCV